MCQVLSSNLGQVSANLILVCCDFSKSFQANAMTLPSKSIPIHFSSFILPSGAKYLNIESIIK
jgi:hypothetical protein